MKFRVSDLFFFCILAFGAILSAPSLSQKQFAVYAQNSISGNIYGIDRRPMADLYVELQDDYRRMLGRTQTNGSGYYQFRSFSSGTLNVHVITLGTEYEEQDQEVVIQNTAVPTADGGSRTGGFDDAQKDFYLRLRPGITLKALLYLHKRFLRRLKNFMKRPLMTWVQSATRKDKQNSGWR